MAVVSSLGSSWTTAAGAKTVVATPALLDLIVIICGNSGRTAAQAPTLTDNNSGGHGTYVQVKNATTNTSADSIWVFIRADRITSATSTTFTFTPVASDTGGGLNVLKVTAMSISGPAAARATGAQSNQAAAGTPAPTFPQAALTGNAVVGGILNAGNPATMTAPASWTEAVDLGYITPQTGLETAFRSSGETGSTITWGSASATAFASVIVELDTSVPIVNPLHPLEGYIADGRVMAVQSPMRASLR